MSFQHRRLPLALAALALVWNSPLRAAATWLKLETPDVVIYSDASPKDVVEFAVGYIAYRQAFHQLFAPPTAMARTKVLLFRRLTVLQSKLPLPPSSQKQLLSFSIEIDGAVLDALAVDGDRRQALKQTSQFETVWALHRCGYYVPLWMAQGSGEVLEAMAIRNGNCEVGGSSEYLWGSSQDLPWPRFFEINTGSEEYSTGKCDGCFHTQAWALMNRVLLGSPKPSEAFGMLAVNLRRMNPIDAVSSVLGVPMDKFDASLKECVRRKPKFTFAFDADAVRKTLVPVSAPELELTLTLSDLLFAAQKTDEGELALAKAQVLAPSSPLVKEARARSALREHQTDEAIARYREAIAAGSTNPIAYLRSAEDRLHQASSGNMMQPGEGGTGAMESVAEIRKALALSPGNPEAYTLLGRAFFLAPDITEADIAELTPGISRGTAGGKVRYYRALLYKRFEKYADYVAELREIVQDPLVERSLVKQAGQMLVEAKVTPVISEAESLVKARKVDEAAALLAKAVAEETDPALLALLRQRQSWVAENQAWNEVRLAAESHDWSALEAAAKKFLTNYPKSEMAPKAQRILDEAKQQSTRTDR